MFRKALIVISSALMGVLLLSACEGSVGPSGPQGPAGPAGSTGPAGPDGIQGPAGETDAPEGEGHGSHQDPNKFTITLEPFGHWHVFGSKKLLFTVTDTESGQPVDEMPLEVQVIQAGSTRVTSRTVADEQVVAEGNGIYSLEYTHSNYVPHSFIARCEQEGQVFASQSWVAEIARDGEEGIRVDANGTSYVYQVRYNWDPGHGHASDTDSIKLVFEIMRGVQEGGDINWEQPYRNTFNHIVDADHAEVVITTHDGSVDEEVHPVYKGKGVYEAERIFPVAEVGDDGKEYDVIFRFTDPYNNSTVQNSEHFELHVVSPH